MVRRGSNPLGVGVLLFLLVAGPAAAQHLSEIGHVRITNRSYRQIFEPYLFPQGPVFVTGDAVLQAYHELLAESMSRFERAAAARLLQTLRLMRKQVAANLQEAARTDSGRSSEDRSGAAGSSETAGTGFQGLRQQARWRARIVVSVALQLMGEDARLLDPDIAALVATETRRVVAAEGDGLPEWFGEADDRYGGIDYTRFRPHGYHRQSEPLKRYFRAVRWLQSIPFRLDSDQELLAILLLSKALASQQRADREERRAAENYLRCFRDLFGRQDDRDLLFAAAVLKDRPADLDAVRRHLQSIGDAPAEQITSPDRDSQQDAFFIIAPLRLPDEQFFRRRQADEDFSYTDPGGLEIAALLGSDFARSQLELRLPDAYRQSLQVEIDRFAGEMASEGLYNQYLHTVAALVDPPEPDAPAFTGEPAWKAKSCNAALAGWVRIRNPFPVSPQPPGETIEETFTEVPTGFVEPDPEFFDRLGQLSERAANLFDRCGALPAPAAQFAGWLRRFDRLLAEGRYPGGDQGATELTRQERGVVVNAAKILATLAGVRVQPATVAGRRT